MPWTKMDFWKGQTIVCKKTNVSPEQIEAYKENKMSFAVEGND